MDEPSGVTQEEGHRIFFFFLQIYSCRCLVKSINITSRNSNAFLRVPILLVVQLNLHFVCATYNIYVSTLYRRRCSRYVFVIPFMQSGLQAKNKEV